MSDTAKVRTAVIPAAGRGSRLAPLTSTIPKPLLPLVDTPALGLCVAEAAGAGVRRVVVVTSGEPFVDDLVRRATGGIEARVDVVHQREPRGLGDAVRRAWAALGPDEPGVAVLLPDVVPVSSAALLGELLALAAARGGCAVNLIPRPATEAHQHGVADVGVDGPVPGSVLRVRRVVEKPALWDAGPTIGVIGGRYVLSRAACEQLAAEHPPVRGEHGLDRLLTELAARGELFGLSSGRDLADIGRPEEYAATWVRIALRDPVLRRAVLDVVRDDPETT
ncbi:sugar phosphate nucleotidyltransferase [Streptomyces sp. NPDC054784]